MKYLQKLLYNQATKSVNSKCSFKSKSREKNSFKQLLSTYVLYFFVYLIFTYTCFCVFHHFPPAISKYNEVDNKKIIALPIMIIISSSQVCIPFLSIMFRLSFSLYLQEQYWFIPVLLTFIFNIKMKCFTRGNRWNFVF